MTHFDAYFLMDESAAIEYAKLHVDFLSHSKSLTCEEIGDGNLNYIFRVEDKTSGRSVIIKQAGDYARLGHTSSKLSRDRNLLETETLILYGKLIGEYVPKIYRLDATMNCCIMEDLKDYNVLRGALLRKKVFPNLVGQLSSFLATTLVDTSDIVMDHQQKRQLMSKYINEDLCDITERLVFTEPYNDYRGKNQVNPLLDNYVKKEFYQDENLHLKVAELKFTFMNTTQALIHGDLHTGSIMANTNSIKIFDPEFAIFGPMGYDVGNAIAHLIFAWGHEVAVNPADHTYSDWLLSSIKDLVDQFKIKFIAEYNKKAQDRLAKTKGFEQIYLQTVLNDSAGFAGTELVRRIIGYAKIEDVMSISDVIIRSELERMLLCIGKDLILNKGQYSSGIHYQNMLSKYRQIIHSKMN